MKRYSLFVQLVVYIAVAMLFLLGIVGAVYYHTSSTVIRETTENSTRNTISQGGQFVQSYLEKLKETTNSLARNELVKTYAEESTIINEMNLRTLFDTVLSTDRDLVSAVLVTKSGYLVATDEATSMKTSSDMMKEPWYQAAIQEGAMPVLTPARQNLSESSDKWVVSITQEVVDTKGDNLAVIRLDIAYDTLSRYLDSLQLGANGFTFIINHNHEFVYHPQKSVFSSSQEMKALEPYILAENGYVNQGASYVYQYQISQSDWVMIGVASMENLHQLQGQIMMSFVGTGLLALGICFLGIWFILRHWIKPLRDLQETILAIGNGDASLRAREEGAPELVDLAYRFNCMLDQIDKLMRAVKEEEQNVRKYELQALSSQINPHFLYNTLDTIVWMAEFNNSKKVVDVTKSLAKYFRLALNQGNEQISLKDEIDHVRQYLFIQKQRYGKKLTFEIEEDARFDEFQLPKLVLQPLVENAIYHGIKEIKGQGLVRVSVEEQGSFLVVSIYDNGRGFTVHDTMENLLVKLGGVGLKNVNQRLRLQFGEQYKMLIDSKENSHTLISLFFPKNETF
ncbi:MULTISPECIES: sensor histidine kinase [unclassified Streptococcus]|uniref:cache domain-containing sensor histidine kinase n=1 Tax=unclassified Streptococcus TaxID=2608887 RepID=UPI001071AE98|nr:MULTISPECIES: sensor histidine kinase [unclassified Streptococcus]MBF0786518.1 sensor histidine kinase [Streptococcus sp. 19428wC2_LYSM12]MCQ9212326.1 sensor histidine kinase [Streptococcus sp. B01]MCQ9213657.1 sensor histidine kinase [Streptococcus sp. O1]TFV06680.1 sensor histidine kinase [Streptococcus sp. LYSM12]